MSDEITPITRTELFYSNILGATNDITPITREEIYLDEIASYTADTYTKTETDNLLADKVDTSDLTPSTGSATLEDLFSSSSTCTYQKYGRIVIISFDLRPSSDSIDATSGSVTIGTTSILPIYGTVQTYNLFTPSLTGSVAQIRVTTTGNIDVYIPQATWTSSYYLRGQIVYISAT